MNRQELYEHAADEHDQEMKLFRRGQLCVRQGEGFVEASDTVSYLLFQLPHCAQDVFGRIPYSWITSDCYG